MKKLLILLTMLATPAFAVEPHEVLDDPGLEARAREISKDLRCLVCQNENIDSSNAGIAADLRVLVRERLVAGDTDQEVVDFVVDRYGEFVLLNPRIKGNLGLWLAGPIGFVIAAGAAVLYIRRRPKTAETLTDAEEARLKELLAED